MSRSGYVDDCDDDLQFGRWRGVVDEAGPWRETPEQRFIRMREWVASQIKDADVAAAKGAK